MMPLSYCTILGGMMTLIGSSTNLLVAGTAAELGMTPLGFFDFAVPGAVLAAIGFVYVLFVAPHLMPKRETEDDEPATSSGNNFLAQFTVEPQSPLIEPTAGKTSGWRMERCMAPKPPEDLPQTARRPGRVG